MVVPLTRARRQKKSIAKAINAAPPSHWEWRNKAKACVLAVGLKPISEKCKEVTPRLLWYWGVGFTGGDEQDGRCQHQNGADGEDRGVGLKKRKVAQQKMGGGGCQAQQTAAKETPSQQPAASAGGDRAPDDVVIGHRHDAADEGVAGPKNKEDDHQDDGRGIAHDRDGDGSGPDKGEQPAEAERRTGKADGDRTAGQRIDEAGDGGRRIDRRRSTLKPNTGPGDAPKARFFGFICHYLH